MIREIVAAYFLKSLFEVYVSRIENMLNKFLFFYSLKPS